MGAKVKFSKASFPSWHPKISYPIYVTSRVLTPRKCLHTLESIISFSLPLLLNRSCDIHAPVDTTSPRSILKPRTGSNSPFVKAVQTSSNFEFSLGYSVFAKRASRAFPPPFTSTPPDPASNAFSSYHFGRSSRLHRHPDVHYQESIIPRTAIELYSNGETDKLELLRGVTNGDDAVAMSTLYLGVADGVGAWNTRPQGHAALWSRLLLHFWSIEVEDWLSRQGTSSDNTCDVVEALQEAYQTVCELTPPWQGTTTACLAMMTGRSTLTVLNLGDSQCFVFRPKEEKFILRTMGQWHWFDCPRQLGSNSHDTPRENAAVSKLEIEDGDVVIVATDGLPDNLWEHEILEETLGVLKENKGKMKWNEETTDGEERENVGVLQKPSYNYSSRFDTTTSPNTNVRRINNNSSNSNNNNNGAITGSDRTELGTQTNQQQGQHHQPLGKMQLLAETLVSAAKEIATDPFAESPYMERCIEQGLVITGGKLDDISVVVGECRRKTA